MTDMLNELSVQVVHLNLSKVEEAVVANISRDLCVLNQWIDERCAQVAFQAARVEDHEWTKEEALPTHKGQQLVADLRAVVGDKWPTPNVFDSWAFLVTEVGELGDVLLRRGYGDSQGYVRNNPKEADLVKELGDVYLMLCTLATCLEVDLGEALQERVAYLQKKHGQP